MNKPSIKETLERLYELVNLYSTQLDTTNQLIQQLENERVETCQHEFDPHVCIHCGMFKTSPKYQTYLFKRKSNVK